MLDRLLGDFTKGEERFGSKETIKVKSTSWASEWASAKPTERERRFELRESGYGTRLLSSWSGSFGFACGFEFYGFKYLI